MEQENINQGESQIGTKSFLRGVTPFSKHLAMGLFVVLPFVGGYIGYLVGLSQIEEINLSSSNNGAPKEILSSQYLTAELVQSSDELAVSFNNSYEYPEAYAGGKLPLTIDFGDGTSDAIQNKVSHTYETPGTYEVKLRGCDTKVDLFCDQVEIDSLIIEVGEDGGFKGVSSLRSVDQQESGIVNTQTYSLTVEGPAATEFRVLSNEFEIGRFSSDVQFNYGRAIPLLRENTPNTVQIITGSPSTGIDFSITRGDEVVCDPPVGTLTCTFSASPAYTLSSYEESRALPKCADTEFLSAFFADLSPYQISQFQRYFHVDIADLTDETPIFIDQDDSCSQNADLEFTHEAFFETSYSSRESLHIPFGSDRSVTLLFHESDIVDYASASVGDNPATTAHLLLSLNGNVRSINLSGGVRDLYLLLSETR